MNESQNECGCNCSCGNQHHNGFLYRKILLLVCAVTFAVFSYSFFLYINDEIKAAASQNKVIELQKKRPIILVQPLE